MQPPRSILYWKIAVELVGHTFHITVLMGISYRSQSASLWPKIYSFPLLPAFGVFLFVFLSPFLMLNSFWNFLLWVNVFLNIYRPVYSCFFQSPKTSHLFSKGPSFSHQQHKIFFFFFWKQEIGVAGPNLCILWLALSFKHSSQSSPNWAVSFPVQSISLIFRIFKDVLMLLWEMFIQTDPSLYY